MLWNKTHFLLLLVALSLAVGCSRRAKPARPSGEVRRQARPALSRTPPSTLDEKYRHRVLDRAFQYLIKNGHLALRQAAKALAYAAEVEHSPELRKRARTPIAASSEVDEPGKKHSPFGAEIDKLELMNNLAVLRGRPSRGRAEQAAKVLEYLVESNAPITLEAELDGLTESLRAGPLNMQTVNRVLNEAWEALQALLLPSRRTELALAFIQLLSQGGRLRVNAASVPGLKELLLNRLLAVDIGDQSSYGAVLLNGLSHLSVGMPEARKQLAGIIVKWQKEVSVLAVRRVATAAMGLIRARRDRPAARQSFSPRLKLLPGLDICPLRRPNMHGRLATLDCLTLVGVPEEEKILVSHIAEAMVDDLTQSLLMISQDKMAQELWLALHAVAVRLYADQNRRARDSTVPLFSVNGHHCQVAWILGEASRRKLGPLLHFDSHSDMAPMARPEDLMHAVGAFLKDRDLSAKLILNRAMNHIAQAASGAVLTSGFKHVVWARPSWVHSPRDARGLKLFLGRKKTDKDPRTLDDYMKNSADEGKGFHRAYDAEAQKDVVGLMADPADNPGISLKKVLAGLSIWKTIKKGTRKEYDTFRRFSFTMVTPAGPKGIDQKKVRDMIDGLPGDRFVLDIDLDYFATDGLGKAPLVRSHGRPPDYLRGNDMDRAIRREHGLLEDRVQRFAELLLRLLEAGKKPSLIIFSDSSAVPVAYFDPCLEQVPTYTPISQVMYLRSLLFDTLFEIYGEDFTATRKKTGSSRGAKGRAGRRDAKRASP